MLNNKKVVGIICECNPFHKGHKRLINYAKSDDTIIIAVMSGNFVQRGEPAVYDKYKRTSELLKSGVDLVIELPVEYVLSSAKYFAMGAIGILNKLKFVDNIIFGAKITDFEFYNKLSDLDLSEENMTKSKILELSKLGYSYPKIMSKIYNYDLSPNDILALEYIKALKLSKSKIKPIIIERKNDLPTATYLRTKIKKKITCNDFSNILNYKLLLAKNGYIDLNNIYSINGDLSNAINNENFSNFEFDKIANTLNKKNRTLANIKRSLFNIILDTDKNILKKSNFGLSPKYIRILGINKSMSYILKQIPIHFLTSFAPYSYKNILKNNPTSKIVKTNKNGEYLLSDSIKLNILATDLYNLVAKNNLKEITSPIVVTK